MAELSAQEVAEIAQLAMLALTPEEAETMRRELSAILEAMTALAAVETGDLAPMTHAVAMDLRLRADVVEPSLTTEVALASAPARADSSFVVPAVIGEA